MKTFARNAVSMLLLALGASACMVFSGVDDLEVRKDPVEAADASAPTDPNNTFDAGFPWPPTTKDAGKSSLPDSGTNKPALPGSTVCKATGTWSACSGLAQLTTCAQYCQQIGKGCVEDCCATDEYGDYAASVGMYYGFGTTCALNAMPTTAKYGYCTDPVLPMGYDVRCCCR